ncbi:MAG: M28 family peptidase [Planctomycetota bacterium]|nr:MAG: M28 family peptidase [Planctomycetota bacterium]
MTLAKITTKVALTCAAFGAVAWGGLRFSTRLPDAGPRPKPSDDAESNLPIELALQRHVQRLADGIGERNDRKPEALQEACDYVADEFGRAGLRVTVDRYDIGRALGNVVADVDEPRGGREILLVSAPYDSPAGSPGAESSASAVAAMIEVARLLRNGGQPRALRFLAYAYGHQPMEDGSNGRRFSLRRMLGRGDEIGLELQLESLGAWNGPRPQNLPFPWSTILPSRSDYLLLCGGFDARAPLLEFATRMRAQGRIPVEGISGPAFWPALGFSDRVSVLEQGPPCIVAGDTGRWRHPDAGGAMDRAEAIDSQGMARAVVAIAGAIGPRLEL